jgi:hypothetical protein
LYLTSAGVCVLLSWLPTVELLFRDIFCCCAAVVFGYSIDLWIDPLPIRRNGSTSGNRIRLESHYSVGRCSRNATPACDRGHHLPVCKSGVNQRARINRASRISQDNSVDRIECVIAPTDECGAIVRIRN